MHTEEQTEVMIDLSADYPMPRPLRYIRDIVLRSRQSSSRLAATTNNRPATCARLGREYTSTP